MITRSNLRNIVEKVFRRLRKYGLSIGAVALSLNRNTISGKVVFSSFYGGGYAGNPKYIAEEMQTRKEFGELVWLARNGVEVTLPDYIRPVRYGTLRALYELSTAQVWVDNCRGSRYVKKRLDQYLIQTWHCYLSPKCIEKDAQEKIDANYIRDAIIDGSETNLMFANNPFYENVYRTAFWYEGPVIRCGAPRNKPLLSERQEARKAVREEYGLSPLTKICLYAPTFRNILTTAPYEFDYSRVREACRIRFGGEWVFAVRLHPNIANLSEHISNDIIIDMTHYVDAQELLAASDLLITDYSSVLEDHCLTRQPSFIFAPDIDEYLVDRGFYYEMDERPAAATTKGIDELEEAILSYDVDDHMDRIDRFLEKFGIEDDGNGAQVVVDRIVSDVFGGEILDS